MRYINPETFLNQSLIQYVLYCSFTMSTEELAALGIRPENLRDLLRMNGEDHAHLSRMKSLFKLQFDQDGWPAKRAAVQSASKDRELRNALHAAGAPRAMIEGWWPACHKDYAYTRRVWGNPGTGRPRSATEDEEHLLWQEWSAIAVGRPLEALGAREFLELYERTGIELSVIWPTINRWIREGYVDRRARPVGTSRG